MHPRQRRQDARGTDPFCNPVCVSLRVCVCVCVCVWRGVCVLGVGAQSARRALGHFVPWKEVAPKLSVYLESTVVHKGLGDDILPGTQGLPGALVT